MKRKTARCWSYIAGEKGRNRVRVFEHPETRKRFLEVRNSGNKRRIALGNTDREAAKAKADEIAAELRQTRPKVRAETTLGVLFDNYLREVTPTKSVTTQKKDKTTLTRIRRVLGDSRTACSLNFRDAAMYERERAQSSRSSPTRQTPKE